MDGVKAMTPLSAEVVEAVRLRDAATKGPWEIMGPWPTVTISTQPTDYDHETNSASGFSIIATMEEKTPGRSCNEHPDAALVAAAPQLVDLIERLFNALKATQDAYVETSAALTLEQDRNEGLRAELEQARMKP